ncbi:ATP-binding protein [Lysobacter korlensis]|uniref:histidine kinase n=1 Tax=Lysobacter korlensis TaxID=553636 RepID=A0ABV6S0G1_9GAMM
MPVSARLRCAAVFVLALLAPPAAIAALPETPRFQVIGPADGLPSSNVNGIALDRGGYLWAATTDGLARYDGVSMRIWRHVPGDRASLPGNGITTVHVDASDRLWIAVEGRGMSMLDADRRRLRHYSKATHAALGSDDVWAFASQGDVLWFGTYAGGLHRLDAQGVITRYASRTGDDRSLPADTVLALRFDAQGRLWVATTGGLARWTGRDFERVPLPGAQPDAQVLSISRDGDRLWIGSATGLYVLGPDDRWQVPEWSAMFAAPNVVADVVAEPGGRLWLAGARELWRVVPGSIPEPVELGTHGPPRPIQQLAAQRDGALWVPVGGQGLGHLRADWRRLSLHTRREGGLTADLYRGVAPARSGGIWLVGTGGELQRLHRDGLVEAAPASVQRALEGRRLISVVEDGTGRLWLGTPTTLLRVDPAGSVRAWAADSPQDRLCNGPVSLLATAPDATLWVACSGHGLQQRDPATGRVLTDVAVGPAQGLGTGDLHALGFGLDGALWVAGESGLSRWEANARRLSPVPGIVAGDRVFAFAFDHNGGVWLQRLSGLEHYRPSGKRWRLVDRAGVAEGIPGIEGSGLAVDAHGRVWLGSQRGLFRWDPHSRRLRQFGLGDGLSSQEFVNRAFVLDRNGVLSATLADGAVVQFDTMLDDPRPLQAPLRLDALQTRRDGAWAPLDPQAATLAPDERELRVVLRLLAFDNPRANRYRSRLLGHDRDWVTHGGSDPGERVFSGIAPGTYTLEARATDAAGHETVMAPLRITVQAPWWRTPWAMVGFALACALLGWSVLRAERIRIQRRERLYRTERERELANEASLAKTRFLATLGHEVRTPMTGVLGMSELLLETPLSPRQRDYAGAIRTAGEHLLTIVNDALDLARIEAGRIELADEAFDLRGLVGEVHSLMAPLAQRRGLAFHIDIASDVPQAVRGDASRVRQILLNLLGNAIKFTESGHVALRVDAHADVIRFAISDTGPGLSEQHCERLFRRFEQADGAHTATRYGGSGLGLAICQELATAMGGCIGVVSAPGQGTRFEVDLPLAAATLPIPARCEDVLPALSPLRLLLVEDDPTVAEVVSAMLRAQGHEVVHVGHGLAALAEIATATFDLVLLDLDLPGLDGIELARHLRTLGFDLPLVALTARADAGAEAQSLAAGFDRFLRKPVTGAMLAAVLRDAVSAAEMR